MRIKEQLWWQGLMRMILVFAFLVLLLFFLCCFGYCSQASNASFTCRKQSEQLLSGTRMRCKNGRNLKKPQASTSIKQHCRFPAAFYWAIFVWRVHGSTARNRAGILPNFIVMFYHVQKVLQDPFESWIVGCRERCCHKKSLWHILWQFCQFFHTNILLASPRGQTCCVIRQAACLKTRTIVPW